MEQTLIGGFSHVFPSGVSPVVFRMVSVWTTVKMYHRCFGVRTSSSAKESKKSKWLTMRCIAWCFWMLGSSKLLEDWVKPWAEALKAVSKRFSQLYSPNLRVFSLLTFRKGTWKGISLKLLGIDRMIDFSPIETYLWWSLMFFSGARRGSSLATWPLEPNPMGCAGLGPKGQVARSVGRSNPKGWDFLETFGKKSWKKVLKIAQLKRIALASTCKNHGTLSEQWMSLEMFEEAWFLDGCSWMPLS